MHIAHVNLSRELRGGEFQTAALVRALAQSTNSEQLMQTIVLRNGSAFHEYWADALGNGDRIEAVRPNIVAAVAAGHGADIVHIHEGRSMKVGALLSKFGSHFVATRRIPNRPKDKALTRWVYAQADLMVCVSQQVASVMSEYVDRDRVNVIHDCIRQDARGVQRVRSLGSAPLRIATIGAIKYVHKGQDLVVETARRLADRPNDYQFVIAGDGDDMTELRSSTSDVPNIEILGWVDDIAGLLDECDLLLHPARKEGLGSVLLEAMASGVPVLAANVDGIPDIVEHNLNGLLFESESVDAIVEALREVRETPGLLTRLSEQAIQIADRFSAAAMAEQYLDTYRSLDRREE